LEPLDEFDELNETDEELVTIIDEDGNELEFFIIDSVTHKDNNYLLVTPADTDEDDEDFEATIIKQTGDSDNTVVYALIEDDNEFNEVAALFMENEGDYEIEV